MLRQIPLFILEDCQRDWSTISHSGNLCTLCFLPSLLLVSLSHLLIVLFGIAFLQNHLASNPCLKICFWEIQTWTHTNTQITCARARTHTHTHTLTHTLFILEITYQHTDNPLEMGGWRTQRFTSQSLAFLNLLFALYWVSNPISYTPQPRHNGLLSAVFFFFNSLRQLICFRFS